MKYFVVDAFTDSLFRGNPAGVCLLESELDDATMQSIAAENNLSETAFVTKQNGYYGLRWFTPKTEICLCGHATLGCAFVITQFVDPGLDAVRFETQSGTLVVRKTDDLFELDFPSRKPLRSEVVPQMEEAVGVPVLEAHTFSKDVLLLLESEAQVRAVAPDFDVLKQVAGHGVIVTAQGASADFVSRFFAPNVGVPEDPVTGSAHTILIPFWAERLGKAQMTAKQLSKRGGTLLCGAFGDRVKVAGKAVLYLQGEIFV